MSRYEFFFGQGRSQCPSSFAIRFQPVRCEKSPNHFGKHRAHIIDKYGTQLMVKWGKIVRWNK